MIKIKNYSGIYIHIPFCRKKCDYCSFYSVPVRDLSIIDSYVERLLKEIDYVSEKYPGTCADTVYFGGGTPSILKPHQAEKILRRLSERFVLSAESEVTLEMNPDDLTSANIDGFTSAGINRIVLGVQSLDSGLRSKIGRGGKCVTDSMFELFFNRGKFTRCIDIMAGLSGQEEFQLAKDLEVVTAYRPEHISLYLLSVDEGTPLGRRFSPDENFENMQADLWGFAAGFLGKQGYIHYEISNYALPGFESRHNSKYWDFTPYYGFGPGAHSFIDGKRISNRLNAADYIKSSEFQYDAEVPGADQIVVEFIMTSLRRMKGFSADEFTAVTSVPLPENIISTLNVLKSEGMIEATGGRYFLSKKGLYFADAVIYRIVEQFL